MEITQSTVARFAEAAAEFRKAEKGFSDDGEYEAGLALAELAEGLAGGTGGTAATGGYRFGEDVHKLVNASAAPERNAGRAVIALCAYAEAADQSGSAEETARDLVVDLLHLARAAEFTDGWLTLALRQHGYEVTQ